MTDVIHEQDLIEILQPHCGSVPAARAAAKAVLSKYGHVLEDAPPIARRKAVIAAYERGATIEELAERYKLFPGTIKGMVGA